MTKHSQSQRQRTPTAVSSVTEDLASRIIAGMTPGTSLKSEADMATHYGVSRVTIREAVKTLAGYAGGVKGTPRRGVRAEQQGVGRVFELDRPP